MCTITQMDLRLGTWYTTGLAEDGMSLSIVKTGNDGKDIQPERICLIPERVANGQHRIRVMYPDGREEMHLLYNPGGVDNIIWHTNLVVKLSGATMVIEASVCMTERRKVDLS
jgi:hypothetical protein